MIETTFSIKQISVDDALKQAEAKAKKTGEKIDSALNKKGMGDKFKQNIDKMKKGLQGAGVEAGKLGKIGDIFSSAGGSLAILTAGLAVLGKQITGIWDKLTLSAQEYAKKQELIIKESTQKTQKELQKQSVDNGYIDRLKQLNEMQVLGNAGKKETIALLQALKARYGELGISIDQTTGKIVGLTEAQIKMQQLQKQRNLKNLQASLGDSKKMGDVALTQALVEANKGSTTGWLQQLTFDLTGRTKKGVWDAQSMIEGLNVEKQIEVLTKLRNNSTTKTQIEAFQKVIEYKRKQLQIQRQLQQIRKSGAISAEEHAKRLKQQTEKSKERAQIANNQKQENENFNASMQTKKQTQKMQQDYDFSKMTDQQKLVELEKKITAQKNKQQALQEQIKKAYATTPANESEKAKRGQLTSRLALDRDRSSKEQTRLEIEKDKILEKTKKYYADSNLQLNQQLKLETLLLAGKKEQAQRQKIIYDLQRKGIKVDNKQVDQMVKKKKLLEKISKAKQENKLQFDKDYLQIKTNELTRRGGFASGAVIADKDVVNRKILQTQQTIQKTLNDIKNSVKSVGVI